MARINLWPTQETLVRGFVLLASLVLVGCGSLSTDSAATATYAAHVVPADGTGVVVSVDPIASAVGAEVLGRGGHAVDAAVAVAFALAVTWPEAGNVGGGGFMLIRSDGGKAVCVDYREMAPAAAHARMFLDETGEVDRYHVRLGYRPVGVPGTVAGLWAAHQRFGRLAWRELVAPAIELASSGFEVREPLLRSIEKATELRDDAEAARIFVRPDGVPVEVGTRLVQADLARSLRAIADGGPDAFYRGWIAERIVAASRAAGGLHTMDDFAAYRAVERTPLRASYRGFEILAAPPPTGGGAILMESLKQLEGFPLSDLDVGSAAELHLLAETLRRSFLDRALHLGDPDFAPFDVDSLLTDSHAATRRDTIDPIRATRSDDLAGDLAGTLPPEGESTTHFSVVDTDGNAVSNTYTLEESWGAKLVAPGTGIVLNNEMHDFNVTPGRSTRSGRVGTAPNTIEPRKRMLSSMCPAIVVKPDEPGRPARPWLVLGSPGGRTIPSTVLRVVTGVIDHGLSPVDAVELTRVHHQLYPDRITVEESVSADAVARLSDMGHEVRTRERQGDCHAIGVDPASGRMLGVADGRRDGGAAAPGVVER